MPTNHGDSVNDSPLMDIKGPAAPHVPQRGESEFSSATGRRIIRYEVREPIPLLRTTAEESERIGALTPETLKAVSEAGVFKLTLSAEYGGTTLSARDIAQIVTVPGKGDAGAG